MMNELQEKLDKVSTITSSRYEIGEKGALELILTAFDELLEHYNQLKQKFIEYDKKVQEHYVEKKFDAYYEYGVSESDF